MQVNSNIYRTFDMHSSVLTRYSTLWVRERCIQHYRWTLFNITRSCEVASSNIDTQNHVTHIAECTFRSFKVIMTLLLFFEIESIDPSLLIINAQVSSPLLHFDKKARTISEVEECMWASSDGLGSFVTSFVVYNGEFSVQFPDHSLDIPPAASKYTSFPLPRTCIHYPTRVQLC